MTCVDSFFVIAGGVCAVIWLGTRTGQTESLPSFSKVLSWWRKSKLLTLLYLAIKLIRGGVWPTVLLLASGGILIVAGTCGFISLQAISQYIINPTFTLLHELSHLISGRV